jgi:hypothetical protein
VRKRPHNRLIIIYNEHGGAGEVGHV